MLRVVALPVDVPGVMRMGGREMRGVTAMRLGRTLSTMLDQLVQDGTDANRARKGKAQNQIAGGELLYPSHRDSGSLLTNLVSFNRFVLRRSLA